MTSTFDRSQVDGMRSLLISAIVQRELAKPINISLAGTGITTISVMQTMKNHAGEHQEQQPAPGNMQRQRTAAAEAKDKVE